MTVLDVATSKILVSTEMDGELCTDDVIFGARLGIGDIRVE